MANGDVYKIRGQEGEDESRQRSYEWAARNVVWDGASDDQDGNGWVQLKGYRFKRAFINRRQIVSVLLDDFGDTASSDLWVIF